MLYLPSLESTTTHRQRTQSIIITMRISGTGDASITLKQALSFPHCPRLKNAAF